MNRIKLLRKQRNLGQVEFARLMGVSQPTVSDWESGRKMPSGAKLYKLSEVLNASVGFIIGTEDTPPKGIISESAAARDLLYKPTPEEPVYTDPEPAEEPVSNNPPEPDTANRDDLFDSFYKPVSQPDKSWEDIIYERNTIRPELIPVGSKFLFRVFDGSMKPRIQEDDLLVVLRQNYIESGELAIVMINRSTVSLKRVEMERNGYLLISNNPFFRPVFYGREDISRIPVEIIGKVIELRAAL